MTDRDSLLEAVKAYPWDDTPRLVLAEWLMEHGEEAYGDFIFRSIENQGRAIEFAFGNAMLKWPDGNLGWPWAGSDKTIRRKGGEILIAQEIEGVIWSVRRGFVEGVTCTAETWEMREAEIIGRHSVQKVQLTTWPDVRFTTVPITNDLYTQKIYVIWAERTKSLRVDESGFVVESSQQPLLRVQFLKQFLKEAWPGIKFELPREGGPFVVPPHTTRLTRRPRATPRRDGNYDVTYNFEILPQEDRR